MSTARQEEIIKKGFIKALKDGTIELKDLAGINPDLDTARQAYIQAVQEATKEVMESVEENMATSTKQDLLKGVMDAVQTAIESLDTKTDSLGTAAKQDLAKAVLDSILAGIASVYADMATGAGQALQATGAKQDLLKTVMDSVKLGTDKIIANAATTTKQDLLKTVMDSVKAAVESVDTKTDLLGTAAKQDLLKGVMDAVQTAIESLDTKTDSLGTAAKQDLAKTVLDAVQTAIESVDTKTDSLATSVKQDLQATKAMQDAILEALIGEESVTASDNNLYAEAEEDITISTVYEPSELGVVILIAGTYRVQFEVKHWDINTGRACVYKNDVAHGGARQGEVPWDEYSLTSEDLAFAVGDTLRVYFKDSTESMFFIRNLELDGDISKTVATPV